MAKTKESFNQLAEYLSSDAVAEILSRLEEAFGTKKELAKEIGCSYPAVKKWCQGHDPGEKYIPNILSVAFDYAPEVRKIVALELFKFRDLGKNLGVIKNFKSATAQYLSELDKESVKILRYVENQRFAHINELADYLGGKSHSEILSKIEEMINRKSKDFFGEPAMEFRRAALDQQTGETVTFSWWLTRTGMQILQPGTEKDKVEVFESEGEVSFLYSTAKGDFSQSNTEVNHNHGILSVKVTSREKVFSNREEV